MIDYNTTYLNLYKVFLVSVLFSLFFFETTNLLFYSIISITVGVGYYLLNEVYPFRFAERLAQRARLYYVPFKIIWILAKHCFTSALKGLWSCSPKRPSVVAAAFSPTASPTIQANNTLSYYDNKMVGNKYKKYIYLFNEKARSNDLIIFKDELNSDITDSIEPYLGPLQNFHGSLLTPADFNHKKIYVFRDGSINISKTFEEDEPIVFT